MKSNHDNTSRLRLLRGGPADGTPERGVAAYTNRYGVTYFLHEVQAKNGPMRYVARRSVQVGALSRMPEAYEFSESLGGMVSVRRTHGRQSRVPIADLELVRSTIAWHPHLEGFIAERQTDAISLQWCVWGRGRLVELAVRHLPRLGL